MGSSERAIFTTFVGDLRWIFVSRDLPTEINQPITVIFTTTEKQREIYG